MVLLNAPSLTKGMLEENQMGAKLMGLMNTRTSNARRPFRLTAIKLKQKGQNMVKCLARRSQQQIFSTKIHTQKI
jgi:hypothetical protein